MECNACKKELKVYEIEGGICDTCLGNIILKVMAERHITMIADDDSDKVWLLKSLSN